MDERGATGAQGSGEGEAAPTPPREERLLPARLSPFAPPDADAERRTSERLRAMSSSQLRSRRNRIDKRLFELGLSIGEQALAIPSVRGTGLVDLDRILRKVDALEQAREQARLERDVDAEDRMLPFDLFWLEDAFRSREIRARRQLLVSELGLALCAADQPVLAEYAPHVKRLLEGLVPLARRIDELFVEMRLVDEEFERRAREGVGDDPPKEIDALLSKALDSVDDVSNRMGDRIAELGRTAARGAARGAVRGSGQAVVGIARSAWALGSAAVGRLGREGEEPEAPDPGAPGRALPPRSAPQLLPAQPGAGGAARIPELIRQLAQLRDEGILSEAEFRAKKADLLSRL